MTLPNSHRLTPPAMAPKSWFAVVGRIPGDDEDSTHTFYAADAAEAKILFEEGMYSDSDTTPDAVKREYGATIFINYVLQSQTEISIIDVY